MELKVEKGVCRLVIKGISCEKLGMNKKIFISDEYKFSTDTILLSDFCKVKNDSLILDIGTGCGTIPLLFCRDGKGKHITAIDIQKDACSLLEMSIEANKFNNKISVIHGDIKSINLSVHRKLYDVVVCNPPYKKAGNGMESQKEARKIARNECMCTIDDIIVMSEKLLKDNGELYMCCRVERMNEILCKMSSNNIEPKLLRLVQQTICNEPKLFLVKGKKFAKSGLRCMPTLIMSSNGSLTEEVKNIYKSFYAEEVCEEDEN